MSVFHYFSSNPDKRAKFIFNFIAPLYGKFSKGLEEKYFEALKILSEKVDLENKTVLDVGTGTGVWGKMFLEFGAKKVTAVDFAQKMVDVASEKYQNLENFETFVCDAEKLEKIPDKSFDIVTASYVLHGVKKNKRQKMLEQMKRVGTQYIIIHDFAGKISPFVYMLEILERSDMPYFRKHFLKEMEETFGNCQLIITPKNTGLYISRIQSA